MNVEKNKNKENLNLTIRKSGGKIWAENGPIACDDGDVPRQVSESKVRALIADEGEAGQKTPNTHSIGHS